MNVVIDETVVAEATANVVRRCVENALQGGDLQRQVSRHVEQALSDTKLADLIGATINNVLATEAPAMVELASRGIAPAIAAVMTEIMLDTTVSLLVAMRTRGQYWDDKKVAAATLQAREDLTARMGTLASHSETPPIVNGDSDVTF